MMQKINLLLLLFLLTSALNGIRAQYPQVPDDVQQKTDKMLADSWSKSEIAWKKAWPVILAEAKKGKPYVPWASRPTDLPQAKIPAFPGAMGGGAFSFGGRGGRVISVTSLEDEGPGTLREACETGGARIVVFKVAGIIRLKSPVIVRAPYITIAGQTAPGDGICVAGESFWVNTHDVVIRHMRFRRGITDVGRRDDAIGGNPVGNIIIDHVSASWGSDENMSFYRHMYNDSTGKPAEAKLPTVNLTIQNSIFAEALDTWNHSFGSTLGGENCSFIRCLWAGNAGRNPSVGWNGVFNFANNVIFNWVHRTIDGGDHTAQYNIMSNYFKPGPLTPLRDPVSHRILKPESRFKRGGGVLYGRAYVNGNVVEGNEKVTADNWDGGVQIEDMPDAGQFRDFIKSDDPFPMPSFPLLTAGEAFKYVLENAGATLPKRDPVDERIIKQVSSGKISSPDNVSLDNVPRFKYRRLPEDSYKKGIITDISQVGGYPVYQGIAEKDSDKDGMPDSWEIKYKLNPNDPADAILDSNGDGYTNIEKFINGINPDKKIDWTKPENNFNFGVKKNAEKKAADEYQSVISQRAEKIIAALGITDEQKEARVKNCITGFYMNLNSIQTYRDSILSDQRKGSDNPEAFTKLQEQIKNYTDKKLKINHSRFLDCLSKELPDAQIEMVKDGLTYGVLRNTYNGYLEMLPGLSDKQKKQIMDWLVEAREHAMDGFTSEEKHAWFGKYKGRINNYLSAEGYDLKNAGKNREKK